MIVGILTNNARNAVMGIVGIVTILKIVSRTKKLLM